MPALLCAWSGAYMAGDMCGRGGGMHGREACKAGRHVWQGGMHGRGACVPGGVLGTHAPRQILRDTVNDLAVRILLECILVM